MIVRKNLEIPAEGGVLLSALYFTPKNVDARLPAVTMAHGYACTKTHGQLDRFAETIAKAGFAVLLHDHRGFGLSGGEPRQDVDPWRQIADWRRVVSFLESRPEVDPQRIGLWGTSYAGGHAIILGATERRIKAVVSQAPTINGYEQGLRRVAPHAVAALEEAFVQDERAQLKGEPPQTRAVVSRDPSVPAAYYDEEAVNFFLNPGETPWENKVTLRSIRQSRMYQPGLWVDKVSPTPLLMIIADHDTVTLSDIALRAYERALEPKRLELIAGSHFNPYNKKSDQAARAAVDWFKRYL